MVVVAHLVAAFLAMHPLHTTLTEVRRVPGGAIELRIRAFADDFSAAVAGAARRPMPRDSSVVAAEAARYLSSVIALRDGQGRALPLEFCGSRREGDVTWSCLRTRTSTHRGRLELRQAMHTELHADQANLVQLVAGNRRRSTLFTADDGWKVIVE